MSSMMVRLSSSPFVLGTIGELNDFLGGLTSLCIAWIHNDSMYVKFGGIRNTKTWSKSNEGEINLFFYI